MSLFRSFERSNKVIAQRSCCPLRLKETSATFADMSSRLDHRVKLRTRDSSKDSAHQTGHGIFRSSRSKQEVPTISYAFGGTTTTHLAARLRNEKHTRSPVMIFRINVSILQASLHRLLNLLQLVNHTSPIAASNTRGIRGIPPSSRLLILARLFFITGWFIIGADAAPFTSGGQLKTAVDNCLQVDATGVTIMHLAVGAAVEGDPPIARAKKSPAPGDRNNTHRSLRSRRSCRRRGRRKRPISASCRA